MRISPNPKPLDESPLSPSRSSNWIAKGGGLPPYVRAVARGIAKRHGGVPTSRDIAIAISATKRWTAKSKDASVKARSAKSVAQWEALKAKQHLKKAIKNLSFDASELRDPEGRWVDSVAKVSDLAKLMMANRLDKGSPKIQALAEDIKKNGVTKPLQVEETNKGPFLSDGHHRLLAAQVAGLTHVPVRTFANTPAGRAAANRAMVNLTTDAGEDITLASRASGGAAAVANGTSAAAIPMSGGTRQYPSRQNRPSGWGKFDQQRSQNRAATRQAQGKPAWGQAGKQKAAGKAIAAGWQPPKDPNIADAVKAFQKAAGLPVTGTLDAATVAYAQQHPTTVAAAKAHAAAEKKATEAHNKQVTEQVAASKKRNAAIAKANKAAAAAQKKQAAAEAKQAKAEAKAQALAAKVAAKNAKAAPTPAKVATPAPEVKRVAAPPAKAATVTAKKAVAAPVAAKTATVAKKAAKPATPKKYPAQAAVPANVPVSKLTPRPAIGPDGKKYVLKGKKLVQVK